MNQRLLERNLARATGESLATIRRMGFSLFDPERDPLDLDDVDCGPTMIDWDEIESQRIALACQA